MTPDDSRPIVVYWAPWWNPHIDVNIDIMFHEPISSYKDLMQAFRPPIVTKNYMQCPAVKNELESTYLFLNPAETEITITVDKEGKVEATHLETESTIIPGLLRHAPTLTNHTLIEYQLSYMFFAEESLDITMTSPYFHKTNYTNYAAIVPGTYDCGKWFRPLNIELQLWEGNNFFRIERDEPLVYFRFNTNRKIVFKRFRPTNRLYDIAASLVSFKGTPRWFSLKTRYENFHRASMRGIVLQEICDNLVNA